MRSSASRRGTLLVVILGLITIFLALMLAITVRVYNSTKNGTTLQQNVQAYLMMIAAKKVIAGSSLGAATLSGGDDANLYNPCGRPFANALGWFHIRNNAGTYQVVAAGGSSAVNTQKNLLNDGDPDRNAYEVRLYYTIAGPAPALTVDLQKVQDYTAVW